MRLDRYPAPKSGGFVTSWQDKPGPWPSRNIPADSHQLDCKLARIQTTLAELLHVKRLRTKPSHRHPYKKNSPIRPLSEAITMYFWCFRFPGYPVPVREIIRGNLPLSLDSIRVNSDGGYFSTGYYGVIGGGEKHAHTPSRAGGTVADIISRESRLFLLDCPECPTARSSCTCPQGLFLSPKVRFCLVRARRGPFLPKCR